MQLATNNKTGSSSTSLWLPEICSSPLHSGGLSMDNPFEMFDEVGRSLKWFSLSRTPRTTTHHHHSNNNSLERPSSSCLLEDVQSYDSDSSSIAGSWSRRYEGDGEAEEDELQRDDQSERCQEEEVQHGDHSLRIQEIFDEDDNAKESPWSGCREKEPSLQGPWDDSNPKLSTSDKRYGALEAPVLQQLNEEELYEGNKVGDSSTSANHEPFHVVELRNLMEDKQKPLNTSDLCTQLKVPVTDKDPVSGLVRSFFSTQRKPDVNKEASDRNNDGETNSDMLALQKRIDTLESDNIKMKKETQRLSKLLKEKEEEAGRFVQERASWEKDLKSMHAYQTQKEELIQELKREKRLVEKQLQLLPQLAALPSKAERKEIADLKAKLMDVHEEHMKKEARLRLTIIRLRKLVKELSGSLNEKEEEIKRYEKLLTDLNAPATSKSSPSESHVIKAVECSSQTAAVGCRITGALFNQRADTRGKRKSLQAKELSANSSRASGSRQSLNLLEESPASPCKKDEPEHQKRAIVTSGFNDIVAASNDGTLVVERPDTSASDSLLKDRTEPPSRHRQSASPIDETVLRGSQRRSMVFTDGTREEEYQDGLACVYFANGDIKNTLADGTTEYYYAEIDTWHTTKTDGVEIFYFPHNQIEEHWPDGHKRVIYPDGSSSFIEV